MPTHRHARIITASVIGALGLAAGLALSPAAQDSRRVTGVSGGDRYLFRVYDNGDVQSLDLKSAKTAKGIAGWTPLAIDNTRESKWSPSR